MIAFLDLIDKPEDKNKFERLYNKYNRLAFWVAEGKVHNRELAEECVQETFLSIAKNFHKIGDVDDKRTRSYVATIAQGFAIKAYNKDHRATFVQMEEKELEKALVQFDDSFKPDKVDIIDLNAAMNKLLNEEERNLVHLVYVYEMSVSEVARMYETTNYFITKKVNAAVLKLKRYINKED